MREYNTHQEFLFSSNNYWNKNKSDNNIKIFFRIENLIKFLVYFIEFIEILFWKNFLFLEDGWFGKGFNKLHYKIVSIPSI